jgi:amino acid transporter
MTRREQQFRLSRTLGFWTLTAYGVGDILGAGIYALVGKIAGLAGSASWLAFSAALVVASLTALSYAELGSRFPRSGGEAYFCQQAFHRPWLALLVGWLVFCSGVVSLATVSRALAGYALGPLGNVPGWIAPVAVVGFLLLLTVVNFSGMRPSSYANIACTLIEVFGLALIVVVGTAYVMSHKPPDDLPPVADSPSWIAIAQGSALAFFAFIGFEDMVNVAEEVKAPQRQLPLAIITALVVAGAVYLLVVIVSTHVVAPKELAASGAPLLLVVERSAPAIPAWSFTLIALFAVANTGLLNFIMGSRLVYGMARQGLLPSWLGAVHQKTCTPHWAILTVLLCALALALSGTLTYLAGTTSVLILLVFATVNLALVVVRLRQPDASGFQVYLAVPILGFFTCIALVAFLPWRSHALAAVLILAGLALLGFRGVKSPSGAAT